LLREGEKKGRVLLGVFSGLIEVVELGQIELNSHKRKGYGFRG